MERCCVERFCPLHARKNPEVSGFIWDRVGGSINFISNTPCSTSRTAARGGCYKDCDGSDDDDDCGERERDLWYCREEDEPEADRFALCSEADGRVYGLSPTSIISAIGTVSGLVCALLMPFVGAVVDYTSQRWQVACATAALLVGSNALQIFLSSGTWFTMVLVQSTVGVGAYMAHQACLLAYVPELSKNQADIPAITGTCKACESAAIILFLIVAIGVGGAVIPEGPSRDVQLARVGQIAAVALGGPLMAPGSRGTSASGARCTRSRPARSCSRSACGRSRARRSRSAGASARSAASSRATRSGSRRRARRRR